MNSQEDDKNTVGAILKKTVGPDGVVSFDLEEPKSDKVLVVTRVPDYVELNEFQAEVYQNNYDKGFWPQWMFQHPEASDYVYAAKVGLIHTEVSEMMEALRSVETLMSEKIPGFTLLEEEAADAIIRILDLTGSKGLKIGQAIIAKLEHNKVQRPHKHGKRF